MCCEGAWGVLGEAGVHSWTAGVQEFSGPNTAAIAIAGMGWTHISSCTEIAYNIAVVKNES